MGSFGAELMVAQANSEKLSAWAALSSDEKNSRGCIDFTDKAVPVALTLAATTTILVRDEDWEHPHYESDTPDMLEFQCMAKNVHGPNPDDKYYMYYCQHDSWGGIGCAIADSITGPYTKLKALDSNRTDSQVLKIRSSHLGFEHYSSPQIAWNSDTQLWHMYFHFYHFDAPTGGGWQHTTVATCPDLATHNWSLYQPTDGLPKAILPAAQNDHWRNVLAQYAVVARLPNDKWLAAVRGNGATIPDPTNEYSANVYDYAAIGAALSDDGLAWTWADQNPVISSASTGGQAVSPLFVGYMGNGLYMLAYVDWAWRSIPRVEYTKDFRSLEYRHPMTAATFDPVGMPVTAWREGSNLYLFGGHNVYTFMIG